MTLYHRHQYWSSSGNLLLWFSVSLRFGRARKAILFKKKTCFVKIFFSFESPLRTGIYFLFQSVSIKEKHVMKEAEFSKKAISMGGFSSLRIYIKPLCYRRNRISSASALLLSSRSKIPEIRWYRRQRWNSIHNLNKTCRWWRFIGSKLSTTCEAWIKLWSKNRIFLRILARWMRILSYY